MIKVLTLSSGIVIFGSNYVFGFQNAMSGSLPGLTDGISIWERVWLHLIPHENRCGCLRVNRKPLDIFALPENRLLHFGARRIDRTAGLEGGIVKYSNQYDTRQELPIDNDEDPHGPD